MVAVIFFLILSSKLFADHTIYTEAGNRTAKIKLNPLIEEALEKNAQLKAAQFETQAKAAQISPAGAYEDPMLSYEAMNYPVDTRSSREFGMTGRQISLSQKIPFPGKLSNLEKAAEFQSLAQRANAEQIRLDIIMKVKVAYYKLFSAYKKSDTFNEQKKLITQLLVVTRQKFSLSKASQAEVLALQVEEGNLLDQILTVEKEIKEQMGELNHLLGRSDHNTYLYGRPEDLEINKFSFEKHSETSLTTRIQERNPKIEFLSAKRDAALANLTYAKWNYLPDFEFKVGYTQRDKNEEDSGKDFISGMVGVSLPIWAGIKQSDLKSAAFAEKSGAEALLDEQRIELAHMVHLLYGELEESSQRLELYEGGLLPLSRQAVLSAQSAYLTGKFDYATLLSLVQKRFQMEQNFIEAQVNYLSKRAELEALLGEPL